jgi:hypothetical protein
VSQINGLRAKFGGSVIKFDWKIATIAQIRPHLAHVEVKFGGKI